MATQKERNEVLRLLDPKRKKHKSPQMSFNAGNSWNHELRKFETAFSHMKDGHVVVTEAYFLKGGRCDVLCLDCCEIYEVVESETELSVEIKQDRYPFPINVVMAYG